MSFPPEVGRDLEAGGADVLRAHARLASIDPQAPEAELRADLLAALLRGAGATRGVLLDPEGPAEASVEGVAPDRALLLELSGTLARTRSDAAPAALLPVFGSEATDARAIPLTAGEETLAVLLLPAPPREPVGFASVVAHAASLLARVRMTARVREASFELKLRLWELQSLYDVGLSIAGTLDLESLADDILVKSVSLLNARKGTLVISDDAEGQRLLVKDVGGALLTGEEQIDIDEVYVSNDRSKRLASLSGAAAEKLLGVPILSDGRRLGLLFVADKENRAGGVDDFNSSDERILSLFGNQAAIALENARLHRDALEKERIEREIELAASIQKTILPEAIPSVAGLVFAGANRPTRRVGGDYFNVFPLPDSRTAFCVADVAGKGIPAALLVSTVHACLQMLVSGGASDLPDLVARMNRNLVGYSAARKFVTLFLAVYDPSSQRLEYVNAGHNPALWLSGAEVTLLKSGGMPIGIMPDASYQCARIELSPDDLLLLYTDGITEAVDAADEEFGLGRLTDLFRAGRASAPGEISDGIFAAVSEFTRGVAQYDDQTVLVARVVPTGA